MRCSWSQLCERASMEVVKYEASSSIDVNRVIECGRLRTSAETKSNDKQLAHTRRHVVRRHAALTRVQAVLAAGNQHVDGVGRCQHRVFDQLEECVLLLGRDL